jgi:hypothetical protein
MTLTATAPPGNALDLSALNDKIREKSSGTSALIAEVRKVIVGEARSSSAS